MNKNNNSNKIETPFVKHPKRLIMPISSLYNVSFRRFHQYSILIESERRSTTRRSGARNERHSIRFARFRPGAEEERGCMKIIINKIYFNPIDSWFLLFKSRGYRSILFTGFCICAHSFVSLDITHIR